MGYDEESSQEGLDLWGCVCGWMWMCGFLNVDVCGTGVELCVLILQFRLTSFALEAQCFPEASDLSADVVDWHLCVSTLLLHTLVCVLFVHLHPVTPVSHKY